MAQSSFAQMTNVGLAREAAAQTGGTQIVVTQMAFGDSPTVPSGAETALYHEIARKSISAQGIVIGQSNVAFFEAFLAAADGPYTIREAGLYDSTGAMIAIAHFDPPLNKTAPSSGAPTEATIRVQVAFSSTANVNISVAGDGQSVPLQKLTNLPDIAIAQAGLNAPPASPALGDIYLVGSAPTGLWAGQAGKIAEYILGGWSFIQGKNGHIVSIPNGATYMRIGNVYVQFAASETLAALIEIATQAEVDAGVNDAFAVTPLKLARFIRKNIHVAAGGSANVLTATLSPVPPLYYPSMMLSVLIGTTNTGAATLNVNGLGAKPILVNGGTACTGGELIAGDEVLMLYDGVSFLAYNPAASQTNRGLAQQVVNALALSAAAGSIGQFIDARQAWMINRGGGDYATAGGTIAAMVHNPTPAFDALRGGQIIWLRVPADNTGPATLNISGLGAIPVVRGNGGSAGAALTGGEMKANEAYGFAYDGTSFRLLNPTATETTIGMSRRATIAEAKAGIVTDADVTPAGLAAAIAARSGFFGACYLDVIGGTADATTGVLTGGVMTLTPENGTAILVGGVYRDLPANGITMPLAPTSNDTYFLYVSWNGTALVLEASNTAVPIADTTYGHLVKNGDASRTYVGIARSGASNAWLGGLNVSSRYNKKEKSFSRSRSTAVVRANTAYADIDTTLNITFISDNDVVNAIGSAAVKSGEVSSIARFQLFLASGEAGSYARNQSTVNVPATSFYRAAVPRGYNTAKGMHSGEGTGITTDNFALTVSKQG